MKATSAEKTSRTVMGRVEASYLRLRAADAVLALAAKNITDLIILTPRGLTGLKHVLVGSTAESIMRQSVCPVLSVRRQ
jgi:nucleotide-binding universal stress UspA family protein